MTTPRMSVCVVARNAARTYKPLFTSLREFADRGGDMVLVDTGSTDETVAIYRAFGFRVYSVGDAFQITIPRDIADRVNADAVALGDEPIIGEGASLFDFASARNYAASLAVNDYILNPDADEAFSVFDIDAVEEAFATASRFQYDFVFDHNPDGTPHLQFITDTRLSDRRYWRWKGHVHETNEAIRDDATMRYLPPTVLKIEHWQVPSPTRSNYLPGLAYACAIEPENDRNLHYYGRELLYRHYYRTAIKELKRHLELSDWDMERSQSMVFIGDAYHSLGDDAEAVEWWHRSFALCSRREPLLRIAQLRYRQNRPADIVPYVAAALELARPEFYGNTPEYYTYRPHQLMYWARGWTGNIPEARKHILKALDYDPTNEVFLADLWYYFPKPKVSIVIPSIRPERLERCLALIKENAGYDNYEVIVEPDDPANPAGAVVTFNKGVERATGDLVLCMGDDSVAQKNFLVLAVASMLRHFPALDGMIAFNDMVWDEETAAHWLASKLLLPALDGKFFHEGYRHLYCDNELADRVRALGKFYWDRNVKMLHDHPTTNGGHGSDAHYAAAYDDENAQHDWVLYQRRAVELGFTPHIPEYKNRQH